jgi:hypothetical protein
MWLMFLIALLPGKKMQKPKPGAGGPAVAPVVITPFGGYVAINDDASATGRHVKARRCAERTRFVCEVMCGLQCVMVGLATVWVAALNRKADGR